MTKISYQDKIKNKELTEFTTSQNKSKCVNCHKNIEQERDIQICDNCQNKYNLEKLWKDHDNNKIDALDFNESQTIRNQYKIIKIGEKND